MRVLCFVDYYIPGFKAGGPIRSLSNMIERLGDDIEFWVVTRDRDLDSYGAYSNVSVNAWNTVGKARVYYASPDKCSFLGFKFLLREVSFDVLYLNSFFSQYFSGFPIFLRLLGLCPETPIIIAPRGELAKSALSIKSLKKRVYTCCVKVLGLYRGVIWQASSTFEQEDIVRVFGVSRQDIHVAQDIIPEIRKGRESGQLTRPDKQVGEPLRIVFISRISPIKNLDYLLKVLKQVVSPIQLEIYGPIQDEGYWSLCLARIRELPVHVSASYRGELRPEQVEAKFSENDIFVFPTKGENFGHVVCEALVAGTPVLISDQTLFQSDSDGAVEVLPLADQQSWIVAIERWAELDFDKRSKRRNAAKRYLELKLDDKTAIEANKSLFKYAYQLRRKE